VLKPLYTKIRTVTPGRVNTSNAHASNEVSVRDWSPVNQPFG
jgi:hypothetical protein